MTYVNDEHCVSHWLATNHRSRNLVTSQQPYKCLKNRARLLCRDRDLLRHGSNEAHAAYVTGAVSVTGIGV